MGLSLGKTTHEQDKKQVDLGRVLSAAHALTYIDRIYSLATGIGVFAFISL
jgi:hypothetical protein